MFKELWLPAAVFLVGVALMAACAVLEARPDECMGVTPDQPPARAAAPGF